MNIVYLSAKKGWAGIVTWMNNTACGLEQKGHRVWILSHPDSPLTQRNPHSLNIIPKRFGMDYNPLMILFLIRFIKQNRIDIIVSNIQKELIVGGIAARLCGIPHIRRIGTAEDLNNRFRRRQERLVDHSIIPCRMILEEAMKRASWLVPDRFTTIYNGRNTRIYSSEEIAQTRVQWGFPRGDLIIGCTVRLAADKNIDSLLRVFKSVLQKYPSCSLVITGDGPEQSNLEQLTRQLEIGDKVKFAGFTQDPLRTAAGYDIAILNSSREGFPNTVVEYFAVGRPVIATDVGGIAEMVVHGSNGLLVQPGNQEQLLEHILLLIEHQDIRRTYGRNALKTIEKEFSKDIMVARLETLFENCIHHKKK